MRGLGLNKTITNTPDTDFAYEHGDHGNLCKYIPLKDILIDEDGTDVTQNSWAIFSRHKAIFKSIDEQGLKHPITVLKKDGKIRFACSGGRLTYAVLRGFTHIIGYIANDLADIKVQMVQQAKKEKEYIDEKYINKWWESA